MSKYHAFIEKNQIMLTFFIVGWRVLHYSNAGQLSFRSEVIRSDWLWVNCCLRVLFYNEGPMFENR